MNRDDILAYYAEHLKPKRVRHCLGVEESAVALARHWGADPAKAALAGLLHDCGKSLPVEEMAQRAARAGFEVDRLCERSPGILHAPASADLARHDLGFDDEEVLSAIFWHTVPHQEMTLLETIVSVADAIEPNRDFAGVDELRGLAERDLTEAFRKSLALTMVYVLNGGWVLHPGSVAVYNELTLQREAAERPDYS